MSEERTATVITGHYFEHPNGDLRLWVCTKCGGRIVNTSPEGAIQPESLYEGGPLVCGSEAE